MHPHTRAIVAASAHAIVTGQKVAGLYDHAAGQHLRIAAECRGDRVQALDGGRQATFGGTLPELHDAGDKSFISFEVDGSTVRGYDRGSAGFYVAEVRDGVVQLFDQSESTWFAFTMQVTDQR
ncbi:hypothetical protein [uncultured Sphingomonas sp.]|uniref:hypothetical protein n=1 Tax=uncultured Sphingomonas sp. TaxID=158754 RepID=UPI0025DEA1D6|nr:hypothetical protein [uncultured Sphingomonas sp.]